MADQQTTIAALERVLLTVEAELTELHTQRILEAAAPTAAPAPERTPTPTPTPPTPPPPQRQPVVTALAESPTPPPPSAASRPSWQPAPPVPPVPPVPHTPPRRTHQPGKVPARTPHSIGFEEVLRFGGAGLVILAAIFFVSTAISRGWIGPEAQLALATAVSAALIGFSFRISAQRKPWRAALAITGASALLATGVVGHLGLELLGATTTLGWMAVSVFTFIGLARAHDAQSVAVAGGPAAFIAALLMFAAGASPAAVLTVVILFGLSVLAATWEQSWFGARAGGGTAVGAISLIAALIEPLSQMTSVALPMAVLVVVLLAASQLFDWCSGKDVSSASAVIEARLAAATTPWAVFILSIMIAGDFSQLLESSTPIGWFGLLVGLSVGGLVTATRSRLHPTMTILHQLAALGVVSVSLISLLDGPALMVALLSQAIVSGVLAYQTRAPEVVVVAAVIGAISTLWNGIVIVLAFLDEPLTSGQIGATALFVLSAAAGVWTLRDQKGLTELWKGVWVLHLVWVAASLQAAPQTQMWISLAWAASAIALVVGRSFVAGSISTKVANDGLNVALATLLLTGAKLIFVDLVAVDVLWRAALFFLIGGTFLRLGFLLPKLRQEPEPSSVRARKSPVEAP